MEKKIYGFEVRPWRLDKGIEIEKLILVKETDKTYCVKFPESGGNYQIRKSEMKRDNRFGSVFICESYAEAVEKRKAHIEFLIKEEVDKIEKSKCKIETLKKLL